jgi:hypothetical protein
MFGIGSALKSAGSSVTGAVKDAITTVKENPAAAIGIQSGMTIPISGSGGAPRPAPQQSAIPGAYVAPAGGIMTPATGNYPITPTATAPAVPAGPTASEKAATAAQNFKPAIPVAPPAAITGGQTVEGRLNNLLAGDSKYLQTARDYALQSMNKRGLMQSSIAVGAAEDAAIRNALPIAQQDAQAQVGQDNTYNLHKYDVAKTGVETAAQSLLSTQSAAQAVDKNNTDTALDQQKAYLNYGAQANDRYAQEFSKIQSSTDMTAAQKTGAVEQLKQWKLANDNWLNQSMATFSGTSIDTGPFKTTGATAMTSLASAAPLSYEKQVAAIRSTGVPQPDIDMAKTNGWPLFTNDGRYLSAVTPWVPFQYGEQPKPAAPVYSALPTPT